MQVLSARRNEESTPVTLHEVNADVSDLHFALESHSEEASSMTVCEILSTRSEGQLRVISLRYKRQHHRKLLDVLSDECLTPMRDGLAYILRAAENRSKHDALLLEETIISADDPRIDLVISRVVRMHWETIRMRQSLAAYRRLYQREPVERVVGVTKGKCEDLMAACLRTR
jgi:annexin A7/11